MFAGVAEVPPDAIFDISRRYKEDGSETKLNLGVGAYRTDTGEPYVLNVVKKAEQQIVDNLKDDTMNLEYLPIDGYAPFREGTVRLILGSESPAIADGRVACCQALSGTGALRMGGIFIANNLGKDRTIYISNPTWSNHTAIFANSGLTVEKYRYYKPETKGLDFEGMCEDLKQIAAGSVVLLHACAHNPTGVDPDPSQWEAIAEIIKERNAIPFFDSAYQGYASGDLEKDAFAVRLFEQKGIEMLIAQSYSKNFGLYGERIGALSITTNGRPDVAKAIQSQLKLIVRPMYSNPPTHGARLVAAVLGTPEMYAEWVEELKFMSGRIIEMRASLRAAIEGTGCPGDWEFVTKQIGMFAYTGMTKEQVARLESEFHIYMVSSGRISMAGVSSTNVKYLGECIAKVVQG